MHTKKVETCGYVDDYQHCTTKRELFAVVHFVHYFKPYLIGRPFDIRTDHASLTWLKGYKDGDDQMARWNYELDAYDHGIADFRVRPAACFCLHSGGPQRVADSVWWGENAGG